MRPLFSQNTLPLFHQPWWLDAVCGSGNWGMAEVHRGDGEILGICPYYLRSYFGIKMVRMPPFTPYLGVWLNEALLPQKLVSRHNAEIQVIRQLLSQFPHVAWYSQVQVPGHINLLPFYELNFRNTVRYTYIFDPRGKNDYTLEFDGTVRNKIRIAKKNLMVVRGGSMDDFYKVFEKTLRRNKLLTDFDLPAFTTLCGEILRREHGEIILAFDDSNLPVAGVFLVHDEAQYYLWQMGLDKDSRSRTGAVQLLIFEGINLAQENNKLFNFEGSILPHIEPVFRAFGAELVPVHVLYKASNRWLYAAKELIGL